MTVNKFIVKEVTFSFAGVTFQRDLCLFRDGTGSLVVPATGEVTTQLKFERGKVTSIKSTRQHTCFKSSPRPMMDQIETVYAALLAKVNQMRENAAAISRVAA